MTTDSHITTPSSSSSSN